MNLKNFIEIVITAILVIIALWIFYNGIKRKKTGCNCDNCNSMCTYYRKKIKEEQKNNSNTKK